MKPEIIAILIIFLLFATAEFLRTGLFKKPGQKRDDVIVEVASTLVLLFFTQPFVLFCGAALAALIFPQGQGTLANWPVISQVGLLLIFDDMMQYWWHRITHITKWLYDFHRPHHDAKYMSIRIVYRNNLFYYLMMPGIWFSGALIYLGLGKVYAFYIAFKLLVICGAHSDVRWDQHLYKVKFLSPVMWIIERLISTPATHSAHHGKHMDDGVTHYKGNYGNLLFFWDVLFGTARITRRYPKEIGVENLEPVTASRQLLWPFVRDNHRKELQ